MATQFTVQRAFRVRFHHANVTVPDDLTVQFTVDGRRLLSPIDSLGNQKLDLLKGQVESGPYSIEVSDDGGWFTKQLFAAGLPVMKGRYVDVQMRENYGTWSTVDIRRVGSCRQTRPDRYTVQLIEDRAQGREVLFRRTTSVQLSPPGPVRDWYTMKPAGLSDPGATGAPGQVNAVSGTDYLQIRTFPTQINPALLAHILDDVIAAPSQSTNGNFTELRFENPEPVITKTEAGSNTSKTSSTTVVATCSVAVPVGTLLVARCSADNIGAFGGTTTEHTVTDSAGNVWTKLREHSYAPGASAATGVTSSVWVTIVTVALTTSSTVTLTLTSAQVAKCIQLTFFTVPTGFGFTLTGATSAAGNGTSNAPSSGSLTLDGSKIWVALGCVGVEMDVANSHANDSNWTAQTSVGTTGGTDTDNIMEILAYRLGRFASVTYAPSLTVGTRDWVAIAAGVQVVLVNANTAALTQRKVVGFDMVAPTTPQQAVGIWAGDPPTIPPYVWVVWPSHGFSVGQNVGPFRLGWPAGIGTAPELPFLVGPAIDTINNNEVVLGYTLTQLVKDVLNGVYGGLPIRFDLDAVNALATVSDEGHWYHITAPMTRDQFLMKYVWAPYLIAPVVREDGLLSPKQIWPGDQVATDLLYHFNKETATSAVTYDLGDDDGARFWQSNFLNAVGGPEVGKLLQLGIAEVAREKDLGSPSDSSEQIKHDMKQAVLRRIFSDAFVSIYSTRTLDLFGYGTQIYRVSGHVDDDAPLPGDLAVLNMNELKAPNAAVAARSGLRTVIVLERVRKYAPGELEYHYVLMDAGWRAHSTTHTDTAHCDTHSDSHPHCDYHTDFHLDQHSDVAHRDTHGDAAGHADSHNDQGHIDTHGDGSHGDTHTDFGHSDFHSDAGHGDSHTDQTGRRDFEGDPHCDTFSVLGTECFHADSHTDDSSHGDQHQDQAHGDDHTDGAHNDFHVDTSHGDAHNDAGSGGHSDFHQDGPHTDLHTDVTHGDVHCDGSHNDTHGDALHTDWHNDDHADSHSDTAHSDSHTDDNSHDDQHFDSAHADSHTDVAHGDVAHQDGHNDQHEDVAHGDSHTDTHTDTDNHADFGHGDAHDDVTGTDDGTGGLHCDSFTILGEACHNDSHSDVSHGDSGGHSDSHGDVAHSDGGHQDTHTDDAHGDSPHTDDAHGDTHSDAGHQDGHIDADHFDSHSDTAHNDSHSDTSHVDAHRDQPHADSHCDITN